MLSVSLLLTDVDLNLAASLRGMQGKRGVLLTTVPDGSPAYRTGLRAGDVILGVESYDVDNTAVLSIRLHQAEQNGIEKIKLTILRAGKRQEITYVPR